VVNKQREIIYAERRKVLSGANLKDNILDMVSAELKAAVDENTANPYEPDYEGIAVSAGAIMPLPPELGAQQIRQMEVKQIEAALVRHAHDLYEKREQEFGEEKMRLLERLLLLKTIDTLWVEHLTNMEYTRLQAGWQTLQQTRAADAYKNQGYKQFQLLLDTIRYEVARSIYKLAIFKQGERPISPPAGLRTIRPGATSALGPGLQPSGQPSRPVAHSSGKKVGRNEPCPCGSGKKYKHCCGR
jgi:preprotein translocase subunit SecA